jgi:hypothetical protein
MMDFMVLKQTSTQDLKERLNQLDICEHRLRAKHISTLSIEKERKSIQLILTERKARRKQRR